MPFAAAFSQLPLTRSAVSAACEQAQLPEVDLAVVFFTPEYDSELLHRELHTRLRPRYLLGCSVQGVLAGYGEYEQGPALALWTARFPAGVRLTPFHLTLERTADGPSIFGRPDELLEPSNEPLAAFVLGDPFSFPADFFLERLNDDAPGVSVFGGMASGTRGPQQVRLIGQTVYQEGAVGVLLQGDTGLRSLVSQGCRPIGTPFVVTRAEENVIFELGGQSPHQRLIELYQSLSPEEQTLMQRGLHVGRVIDEYRDDFKQGDFLIRNVMGLDRSSGALVVGDRIRVGQTIQFQVRDAGSADAELRQLLQGCRQSSTRYGGGLLFTCNGRGSNLFDVPDHDAATVQELVGPLALAGFFAAGELGPIGGRNYIHGFTASLALFEEKTSNGSGA
ncbi:MAG: FIST N-terminal domain-containing protein [Gemmataceae bacterium]